MADSHASRYSAQRLASREHIPAYPRGFIALRIVQLALGLIALGLCAFGAYLWPISGNCLMLFVAVATLIVTVWLVVAEYSLPCIYNYWAVLALDIFLVVFWLCAFALLASQAAFVFSGTTYCNVYDCYSSEPTGLYFVFAACMAAASAIGGLQFALFVTSLAIHSTVLHRHRKAGLHCTPQNLPGTRNTIADEKNTIQAAYQPDHTATAHNAPPYAQQDGTDSSTQQHQQNQPQAHHGQIYSPQQVSTPLSTQPNGVSHVR
ncbi:hypothetical protein HYQ45_009246 [Verticillium longisporum]|uniref:MARVEL domain-containing protein n=3 Tax=Verticillium TaxID=1036719 RepID=G2WT98_VERDV|nr:uncharacterized protein VDAG_01021 [Verticillium dahliae VdLs.17]KAG7132375.1 hypothetical protein HYQ45_009246 [Verticillium longisporum]KAH6667646.1 hypothetical protein EV126DRAFT_447148 [Verticillium dahliae]EGY17339.1 hypothetical protein VDAG_01021 [Verticillium dahliae VdLs.17]KAH6701555.1 hypothetical protein EV126DRAFT_441754 [Verticillium dahliae]PNH32377.1 hypothetical protein BJF96_g4361 [Verticillium dahliae]